MRYRCGALSTELWSHRRWEYVIHGRICFHKRFEWKSRMNGWCEIWLRSGHRSCVRIWGNRIIMYFVIAIGLASFWNLALFWDVRGRLRPLRFSSSQADRNENKCWNNQLKDHTNSQELFVNSIVKSLFFIQGFYQVKVIQAGLTTWPLGMKLSLQVKELSYFHTCKMNT